MKKVIGYVVSVVGIFVMALGFGMVPVEVRILEGVGSNVVSGVGVGLVVVGVLISLKGDKVEEKGKKKGKGGEDEVPIYEGVGKRRKVVGYRKD